MPPEPNHDYQELLKLNASLREIVDKELALKERAAELLRQELLRQSPRNLYRQVDEDPEKMIYSNIPWLVDMCLRHIGFVERFQKVSERCGQPLKNIKDAEERLEALLKEVPPKKSWLRRAIPLGLSLLIGAGIGGYFVSRPNVQVPAPDVTLSEVAPTSSPEGKTESDSPAYARLSWGEKIRINIDNSQKLTELAIEFSERHSHMQIPSGGCDPFLHSLYKAMDGPEDQGIKGKFVKSLREACPVDANSAYIILGREKDMVGSTKPSKSAATKSLPPSELKVTELYCKNANLGDHYTGCKARLNEYNEKVHCVLVNNDPDLDLDSPQGYRGVVNGLLSFEVQINPRKRRQTLHLNCYGDGYLPVSASTEIELGLRSSFGKRSSSTSYATRAQSEDTPSNAPEGEQSQPSVGQPQWGQTKQPWPEVKEK